MASRSLSDPDFDAALARALSSERIEAFTGPDGEIRYRLAPKELRRILKRFLGSPLEMTEPEAVAWIEDADTLERWGLIEFRDAADGMRAAHLTVEAYRLAGRWIGRWTKNARGA